MSSKGTVLPEYLRSGDPALKDYYPAWVNNMADDATVEGSMLDGVVQGEEAVRSVVLTIRSLYEHQELRFAGPYGNNGFLEDYVATVNGEAVQVRDVRPGRGSVASGTISSASLLLRETHPRRSWQSTKYSQKDLSRHHTAPHWAV